MHGDRVDAGDIVRRVDAGETMGQIATDLGVTERTLRNRLHAAGEVLPQQRRRLQRQALLDDQEWLRHQYVARGRSPWDIASFAKVELSDVYDALARFDIKRPVVERGLSRRFLIDGFDRGATVSSIARGVGIDRATVRRAMRRHGVTNPVREPKRPKQLNDPSWLRSRYVDNTWSVAAIARQLHVASATVRAALLRHNIPLRHQNTRLEPAIARTLHLDDGLSIDEIAAETRVSAETVRRVLKQQGLWAPGPPKRRWPNGDGPYDLDWLQHQIVVRHRTMNSIATEAGVSISTIFVAMRDHDIQRGPGRRGRTGLADEDWLRTRYLIDGATAPDIATELGVPTSRVRAALARFSIVRRT